MKHLKLRLLALSALVVLTAASLVPMMADASCPQVLVQCSNGKVKSCSGTQVGDKCEYSHSCMHCGSSEEIALDSGLNQ